MTDLWQSQANIINVHNFLRDVSRLLLWLLKQIQRDQLDEIKKSLKTTSNLASEQWREEPVTQDNARQPSSTTSKHSTSPHQTFAPRQPLRPRHHSTVVYQQWRPSCQCCFLMYHQHLCWATVDRQSTLCQMVHLANTWKMIKTSKAAQQLFPFCGT